MSVNSKQYICINPECKFHQGGAINPEPADCYVCGKPLVEKTKEITLSDQERDIINNYPYVIAYPFLKMLEEQKRPDRKISLLKDTLINTLKYITLLFASEYFESDLKCNNINYLFEKLLSRTNSGSLNAFMRESLKELTIHKHEFFIPELPEFYSKNELHKKCKKYTITAPITNTYGQIHIDKFYFTAIGALINFRNKYIGHGVTLSDEKYIELYNEYYPIFLDLLSAMSFISKYKMCKFEAGEIWSLMSNEVTAIKKHKEFIEKENSLWIQNDKNDKLYLIPFFISPNAYTVDTPDDVEVFIYDEYTKNKMVFFSPENVRTETSGTVLQKLKLQLLNKQENNFYTNKTITTDIISNQIIEFNFRFFEQLIREQKIIGEVNKNKVLHKRVYLNREDIESNLRSWTGSRFGMFFIRAEAGSGKTNLMVEMQNQYTNIGLSTLLFRANRIDVLDIELAIKTALDLHHEFDLNDLKTKLEYSQSNPFIILIDGGNEHKNPTDFLKDILTFFRKYSGGFIKIVLTWRADLKEELPQIDNKYNHLIYSSNNKTNTKHLLADKSFALSPLNKIELEEAWKLLSHYGARKYSPKFKLKDVTLFDRKLVKELQNPLHLKLFMELFANKPLPKIEGFFNLWEKYSYQFKNENKEYDLLYKLVEVMFESKTHTVPSKILYEHPVFKNYVANNDIKSPYEQLKLKGVLAEYYLEDDRYLTFSVEAFYYYMLGVFLQDKHENEPPNSLLQLLKYDKLKGLKEGVQQLLINDINNQNYDRLNWLIDNSDEDHLHLYAFPLAHAFKKYEVIDVFKKTAKIQSKNYIKVINSTLTILVENELHRLVNSIHIVLDKYINICDVKTLLLKLKGISYFDNVSEKQDRIIQVENALHTLNPVESDLVDIYNYLGTIQKESENYDEALNYFQKSLNISLKYFGSRNNNTGSIYNNIGEVFSKQHNHKNALKYVNKCLNITLTNNESDTNLALLYSNIGVIYSRLNKNEEADIYLNKSINLFSEKYGEYHSSVAISKNLLGTVYFNQKKYNEALVLYKTSLGILSKTFPENHSEIASIYYRIGNVYLFQDDYLESLNFYEKSVNIFLNINDKSEKVAICYSEIAIVYNNLKDYYNSIKYLKLWWRHTNERKGGPAYEIYECYKKLNEPKEAIHWLEQAALLRIRKERLGLEHETTQSTIVELVTYAKELGEENISKKWNLIINKKQ